MEAGSLLERWSVLGTTLRRKEPFTVNVSSYLLDCRYVHLVRGRGYDFFRVAFRERSVPIEIFFHRGDSPGEGGSSFSWLRDHRVAPIVLGQVNPGGVVVSDGSLACDELVQGARTAAIGETLEVFDVTLTAVGVVPRGGSHGSRCVAWRKVTRAKRVVPGD